MYIQDLNFNLTFPSKIFIVRSELKGKKDYFSNIMIIGVKNHDYNLNENFYCCRPNIELLRNFIIFQKEPNF